MDNSKYTYYYQNIVEALRHEIWEYEARTGKKPERIIVSVPIMTVLRKSCDLVAQRKGDTSISLIWGIPVDVVSTSETYIMVGCPVELPELH